MDKADLAGKGRALITTAIVSLRGLIIIPILTKTLGADAYGIWSVINGYHLAIIASGALWD